MGEYNKTYARISELKRRKYAIEKQIRELKEQINDIKEEIADCEAYLLELDYIDNGGTNDYD